MSDTTSDLPVMQPTPQQLPIPQDNTFTGNNWARNLALLGSQMTQANNARFGAGFLQNPGGSAIPIGIGNAFVQSNALDSQAANTQNTLAEAETKRLNNTLSAFSNDYYRQHPDLLFGTGTGAGGYLNTSLTGQGGVPGPMQGGPPPVAPSSITPPADGGVVAAPERINAMTGRAADQLAARGIHIPDNLQTMFAKGFVAVESGGNTDPNLQNPVSPGKPNDNAFGFVGLRPSTVRDPGYGMQGQDPDVLRKDPQAQLAFAMEYAYRRALAPPDKGGLGMTDKDFQTPGMLAHVAAMYGGATSDQGKAMYVGKVATKMGGGSPNPNATIEQMMEQAMQQKALAAQQPAAPPAAPAAPAQPDGTTAPAQQPQTPPAQTAPALGTPAPLGGQSPQAGGTPPVAEPPSVHDAHSTYNAATQQWENTVPVAQPDSIMARRAGSQAPPIVANSGVAATPPAATTTATQQPAQTQQPAMTPSAVANLPPQTRAAVETLTAQSQAAFNAEDDLRRRAAAFSRSNPALAQQLDQRAAAVHDRGKIAQEEAAKLFAGYQTAVNLPHDVRDKSTYYTADNKVQQGPYEQDYYGNDGYYHTAQVQPKFDSNNQRITAPLDSKGIPIPNADGSPFGTVSSVIKKPTETTIAIQAAGVEQLKESHKQYDSAQNTLGIMTDVLNNLNTVNANPGYWNTGEFATEKLALAKAFNALRTTVNLEPIADVKLLASNEKLVKDTLQAAYSTLSSNFGAAREAASTIMNAVKANPSIESSGLGNEMMVHGIMETARYASDQAVFMSNWASSRGGGNTGMMEHDPQDLTRARIAFAEQRPTTAYIKRAQSQTDPIVVDDLNHIPKGLLSGTMVAIKGTQQINGHYKTVYPIPSNDPDNPYGTVKLGQPIPTYVVRPTTGNK